MKTFHKIASLLALTLALASSDVLAQNQLSAISANLEPGTDETIEFKLTNTSPIYGFQADIVLPTGLQIATKSNGQPDITLKSDRLDASYQLLTNLKNGVLHMGTFSTSVPQPAISGSDGPVMEFKVNVDPEFKGGDIRISNTKFIGQADKDIPVSSASTYFGVAANSISLVPAEQTLIKEETLTLAAIFSPLYTTDKTLTWSSSDESVASVDGNGIVTALYKGTATITATTVNGKTATSLISVYTPVSEIKLNKSETSLNWGETETLVATVLPDDASDKTVVWSSSNPAVATVDENGVVTAIYKGNTTITASGADGKSATCEVTVYIPAESITLDKSEMTMEKGTTATLTATVDPVFTSDETIWSSADESIVTVVNGVVTAVEQGQTTVTAKCGAVEATCLVTVIVSANGITLDKENVSLMVSQTDNITATVFPDDATDKTVTWKSSNESVVTVTADGNTANIVALSLGEAVITASSGLVSAGCKVTVIPTPATRLELDTYGSQLRVGETVTLIPTVYPDDATDKTVTWQSADESIATVDANGIVTATGLGQVNITATCGDVSATCVITVVRTPVTGLSLSNTELRLNEGQISDLVPIVVPADATDPSVTWNSEDPSIASVDANGIVTAHVVGTTIVTATSVSDPEIKATCTIIVERAIIEVSAIVISETSLTLVEEDTHQLSATVTPVNATDPTITWKSSNPAIATVSANGLVTAVLTGTATIYASSSNGLTAECAVTVTPKIVEAASITLSNDMLTKIEGETAELIAIVLPVETTDPNVVWASSNEEIATVTPANDNKAIINALKQGSAIISATTANGLQATCALTVLPNIIAVEGISLNKESLDMIVGDTETLIATITPDDATDKTVTWKTFDPAVATVSETGLVTAISAGTTKIYASSSNGKTAECVVTVSKGEVAVESITLTNKDLILYEGDITDLTAIVLPDDATDRTVTWALTDEGIVDIAPDGEFKIIVTALKIGTTTIAAATANGLQEFCNVQVIPVPVQAISLNKTTLDMIVGDSETLIATITPENATDKTVTWRSSDRAIATVSETGEVTAVSAGTATIYASSSNGKTAECAVTVSKGEVPVESISLTNTELTMHVGHTTDLLAIVRPDDATDKTLTWTISDEEIAAIAPQGENICLITAKELGTTVVTATAVNGVNAKCTVTVIPEDVDIQITLNPTSLDMIVGDTETLNYTITPEDATDKTVTWKSSDRAIATVSETGLVTAISPGVATIYASTVNGKTAECAVTVSKGEVPVQSISLTNTELTIREGHSTDLLAIVRPDDATDKTLTWTSSDETIATVTPEGENTAIISGLKVGVTIVTAKAANGVYATCTVTVIPVVVDDIDLNKTKLQMTVGDMETLEATVSPEDATDKTVTWRSSNPAIAAVSETGEVTAVSVGVATIYASSSNGHTAECEVTVVPGEILPTGITLSNTELLMREGFTTDITAIIYPTEATDKTVTCTSNHPDIATVEIDEESIIITAVKQGVAIITASTVNNLQAICTVTVVPVITNVEDIQVIPTSLQMKEGESEALTAIITPDDATDKTVTWKSSDLAVADVSTDGVVTAIASGSAVIYASSSNGLTAECNVTVTPNVINPTSISVEPDELILMEGETALISATVSPDDATDKTITWSTADSDIATVDNGVVTGITVGSTTVTATTANGKAATCNVIVKPRPLTPRQLLRKGDGSTCTFVIMMDIPDRELTRLGYQFAVGYTDAQGQSQIIADTPLRYCHTTAEIFNNPALDFWTFSFIEYADGDVGTSNLRHLDGREEICFDPVIYGFDPSARNRSVADTEDWITITPSMICITPADRESMHVAIYTTTGTNVYSQFCSGIAPLTHEISLDRFTPGIYLVTVNCDGKTQSKIFVVR